MQKLTVRDVELQGKRVVMRADFNVPLSRGEITDDTRIRAALPTIEYILESGASLVLMSHLGRPAEAGFEEQFSLKPVAARLEELLGRPVRMAADCRGTEARQLAEALEPGDVLLLENTRFHPEEQGKVKTEGLDQAGAAAAKADMQQRQQEMARELASLGEVYVNDAFGSAHRAHASTAIITQFAPVSVAGFLLEKEIRYLGQTVAKPERPFVAIIGGAKVSGKLEVLQSLIRKVDVLLIGGGMAYTFAKAQGRRIGNSLCEEDLVPIARKVLADAETYGVELLLPVDDVVADRFAPDAATQVTNGDIPDGWMGMDIGPQTVARFCKQIARAKTIVWNGPLGCFEMPAFAEGTMSVCRAVAASEAISIIGGGDSTKAVNDSGLAAEMSHISTGGGASLEFLEGKALPGITALTDRPHG